MEKLTVSEKDYLHILQMLREAYLCGDTDGSNEQWNEENVGEDETLALQVVGIDKSVKEVLEKYCEKC